MLCGLHYKFWSCLESKTFSTERSPKKDDQWNIKSPDAMAPKTSHKLGRTSVEVSLYCPVVYMLTVLTYSQVTQAVSRKVYKCYKSSYHFYFVYPPAPLSIEPPGAPDPLCECCQCCNSPTSLSHIAWWRAPYYYADWCWPRVMGGHWEDNCVMLNLLTSFTITVLSH